MSRIRQQVFLVGLMVAFTAASSAVLPFMYGSSLRRRASDRGQKIFRRTRRRLARVRAMVKRGTKPALALLAKALPPV